MAETNTFKIDELKQKVQQLVSLYNNLKAEKETLVNEKISLIKTIEEQNIKISEIEDKYNSLQIAKAVVTKDVAPFTIVGGAPAKLIRSIEPF